MVVRVKLLLLAPDTVVVRVKLLLLAPDTVVVRVKLLLLAPDTVVEMIGPKKTFSFFYGLEMLIAGVE